MYMYTELLNNIQMHGIFKYHSEALYIHICIDRFTWSICRSWYVIVTIHSLYHLVARWHGCPPGEWNVGSHSDGKGHRYCAVDGNEHGPDCHHDDYVQAPKWEEDKVPSGACGL